MKFQLYILTWLWKHTVNIIARHNIQLAMSMYELAPWEENEG